MSKLNPKTADHGAAPNLQTGQATVSSLALSCIDVEKGLRQLQNPALFRKLLLKFAASYPKAGHEIAENLRLGNTVAAAALCHKLKGVSATLALTVVEVRVSELERRLAAGAPAVAMAESLQQAIDSVCAAIALWPTDPADCADQTQALLNPPVNPEQLNRLLAEFLAGLDQDDPAKIEPLLAKLPGRIPEAAYKIISAQLAEFDFRGAEQTTRSVMKQLTFH